jgi:hypothetical protein
MNVITVEGFTPHHNQDRFIKDILKSNKKYHVLSLGRQFGKTLMAINLLLKWSLETNDSSNMWVSPIYAQARKVFDELVKYLEQTNLTQNINRTDLHIKFINGSTINFKSAERPDGLRGYTLDYLVIDEAAFMKETIWSEVLKQATLVKGKKILFLSTPKGKNWFYNIYMLGQDITNMQYESYYGSSYDNPLISWDELFESQKTLPENIYKQEILAQFLDNGGEVFTNLENYCTLQGFASYDPKMKYYAGLDLAKQNDYTVLTILNQNGEVCEIFRTNKSTYEIILNDVLVIVKKYKPQLLVEVNGVGDPLFERIVKAYPAAKPFITTNESKGNIIEELIISLNEGKLKLPSKTLYDTLYNELSLYTFTYSPSTRKVKYGAPNGFHDDIVMSLAFANQSLKSRLNYGQYSVK